MNNTSELCSFFTIFILLCIHECLAREIAGGTTKNIETAYGQRPQKHDDDHLRFTHADDDKGEHGYHQDINIPHHMLPHASSSSSTPSSLSYNLDHKNLSVNIFFHDEDLQVGKKIPFYFPTKEQSSISHLLPKEEADLMPFSLSKVSQILEFFSFSQDSPQAKAIKDTLKLCERPPMKGERKFCATSLESMLDNLSQVFGLGQKFNIFTTTHHKNFTPVLQNYTILENSREIDAAKIVGCHSVPYPYAVFYCHLHVSKNRLFMLSLEGEKDGVTVDAVGICHNDTSDWNIDHPSFRELGVEPGTSPVCHVFPQDNLVWVSSSDSVTNDVNY